MNRGKKLLTILISAAMVLCMMPSMVFAEGEAVKSDDIIILFTNDTHCTIEQPGPESEDSDVAVTKGFAGVAALKEQRESSNNYVALVDAGDEVQGDLAGALSKGAYMLDIMNTVGYDYATPGNHEFDFGMDRFLNGIAKEATFKYLSANFQRADGSTVFEPYAIETYGDKKVAFVGISTPETFTKSTPSYFQDGNGNYIYNFCEGNNGKDLYAAVQKAADAARAAGADYVIAIGHLGIDDQSSPWKSTEVAANTSGIDAFIDGHSHSTFASEKVTNKDGKTVTVSQTGTKLENIGQLTIDVTNGTVTPELIKMEDVAIAETPSEYVQSVIDKVKEINTTVDADTNTVIGTSEVTLDINGADGQRAVRKYETTIGNLCADAYKTVMGADIGLVQGGGVRATVNKGNVTYGNILSVNPWNNMLCVKEATGQEILDALEHGARCTPETEVGGFLQVSGLTFDIDKAIESTVTTDDQGLFTGITGERKVRNVKVNGVAIDPEKTYTVASTEYILKEMGDGFTMWKGEDVAASTVTDVDAVVQYIKEDLGGVIPAAKYGAAENRIQIVETTSLEKKTISGIKSTYAYTGKSIKPEVTIEGLTKDVDYEVSYANNKKVGKATVTVTGIGKYRGTVTKSFIIKPAKAASVKANLATKNSIKVTWKKATGADVYKVTYSKAGGKKITKTTSNTSITLKNLTAGAKYTVKVAAGAKIGSKTYYGTSSASASATTLKKISISGVKKSAAGKVKVSFKNIAGETGYQISKSTSKSGTKIVSTFASTKATSKVVKAAKGKKYYYKVRAYKTVSGKKIYGTWSTAKAYTVR